MAPARVVTLLTFRTLAPLRVVAPLKVMGLPLKVTGAFAAVALRVRAFPRVSGDSASRTPALSVTRPVPSGPDARGPTVGVELPETTRVPAEPRLPVETEVPPE